MGDAVTYSNGSNVSTSALNPGLSSCGRIPVPTLSDEESYIASASLLIQLLMLMVTFLLGHLLRRHNVVVVHETGAALGFGKFAAEALQFQKSAVLPL